MGLNNDTFGNLLRAQKNLELGPDFSQGPVVVIVTISYSNYFFHYNQSYFIQACVPLPFVIDIGNLQFNKTICSVMCINCKLYACLNSSISLRNDFLLILPSQRSLWLPVNLQRPWEEGPMAGLVSRLLEFCVTPVHFNHSAYHWEQIKFHFTNIIK